MRAAIIDDQAICRDELKSCLACYLEKFYAGEAFLIDEFESGSRFLQVFGPETYDIIFIDQYMEGLSGIETARLIRERDSLVALIFVTSSHEHAVESYGVRASGYLVKPYHYKGFEQAMNLAHLEKILLSRFISIEDDKILLRNILWCDRDAHYAQVHTEDRGVVRYRVPFAAVESLLEPFSQFLTCYRGMIVNLDRVQRMDDTDFLMDTGERVPFRKRDRSEIRKQYYAYMFQKVREDSLL